ncbi:TetR/AcrR family transcriptional regulator [Flavihumibacter sp. UBA7668]|uniref:TetR/AcrR family transcriptional regulator n=1 Tax=Flavihumibacter sp. UBA7668 TaxID=1946542 RepID=UPI0025B7ECF8|nr:TetR/AcrR family transcriptional regulator [Flavihumibacter sp. UBA7668]
METFVTLKVSIVLSPIMSEQENRDRILIKSRDLFMKYGIRSVSMDDIASEMGISKKTIYQYFADKEELVLEVIDCKIGESQGQCDKDKESAENAIDEMFKAMEMVEQMFRSMNPSVLLDLKKYHPKAYEKFLQHKNDYIYNTIRDNLIRGIQEELYRPELNIDIIARFRIESMLMPLDPVFYSGNKLTLADVEQQIIEHYLFGIVSMKGYRLVLKYQQKKKKI